MKCIICGVFQSYYSTIITGGDEWDLGIRRNFQSYYSTIITKNGAFGVGTIESFQSYYSTIITLIS